MYSLDKAPPHNKEMEVALLGAMILSNDVIDIVGQELRADDFYESKHKELYRLMFTMHLKRENVDLVTLRDKLDEEGLLEKIGGVNYLLAICEGVPAVANAEAYAKKVKEYSVRRQAMERLAKSFTRLQDGTSDANVELGKLVADVCDLAMTDKKITTLDEAINDAYQQVEVVKKGEGTTGIKMGYADLDAGIGGFKPSELYILAARTSIGKSALLWNFVRNISKLKNTPILMFSLEMSAGQCAMNLLSQESRVNSWELRMPHLSDDEFGTVELAANKLYGAPVFIMDSGVLSIEDVAIRSRFMVSKHGIKLIMVDYLQLLSAEGARSREQEVAAISRGLKQIAMELKVPVIAAAQINRAAELQVGRKPTLANLRESGAIEQDADVVMLMYRSEADRTYKDGEPRPFDGRTHIEVAKHRSGPCGESTLLFIKENIRFENYVEEDVDA